MSERTVEQALGFLGARARLLRDAFARFGVQYMFIGKGAAIAQGFMGATKDIDVFPARDPENRKRLVAALKSIGFPLLEQRGDRFVDIEAELLRGPDFVQCLEPFDLDIVFGPDGFESFEEAAAAHKVEVDGFPLLSIGGIIASKKAAGRLRDRADLPLLIAFKEELDDRQTH